MSLVDTSLSAVARWGGEMSEFTATTEVGHDADVEVYFGVDLGAESGKWAITEYVIRDDYMQAKKASIDYQGIWIWSVSDYMFHSFTCVSIRVHTGSMEGEYNA